MSKIKRILKALLDKVKKAFGKTQHEYTLEELVPQLKGIDTASVLSEIQPGDIVLAAMPFKLEDLAKVEEGHRYRPYIVAFKNDKGIIAYCGTSNMDKYYSISYVLKKESYKSGKDGKISLEHSWFVPEDRLIHILDTLKNSDLMAINEKLYLNNKDTHHPLIDKNVEVYEGFVVRKDQYLYYVYSIQNNIAKLFRLTTKQTEISTIFRDRVQYIDINNEIEADLHDGFIPLGRANTTAIKGIKKELNKKGNKKENDNRMFEKNHRFNYPVGQIFTAGFNSVIYLFSSKGKDYGIEEEDLFDDIPQIKRLDIDHYFKDEVLESEQLLGLVERMSRYNTKLTWLYHFLSKGGDEHEQ